MTELQACLSGNLIWRRETDLAYMESPQEFRYAILNLDKGVPYVLENHAAHIWELTDGSRTVDEICTQLHAIYGGNLKDLSDQVAAFLDQLHAGHLIKLAGTSTPTIEHRS